MADEQDAAFFMVPVNSLNSGDSPRLGGVDSEHARRLAESEDDLPPILVNRADNRVVDGQHRVAAARLRGEKDIRVRYFDGDADEAFLMAVRRNSEHGLPLTMADRESAARRIIRSHPSLSDRAIAAASKLSAHTVARLRSELCGDDEVSGRAYRIGRDGRARPLDAARGRLVAQSLIQENPDASLREIAAVSGISPATVRDVRLRMARGDDAVPQVRRSEKRGRAGQPPVSKRGRMRESRPVPVDLPGSRDQESLLRSLSRDPSLRFSERGRALLRWLSSRATGLAGWESVVDAIPPHSTYLFAELARVCSDEWLAFAERIEGQRDADDGRIDNAG
jgi:ParB-like chromosome segregation protein Spo0J